MTAGLACGPSYPLTTAPTPPPPPVRPAPPPAEPEALPEPESSPPGPLTRESLCFPPGQGVPGGRPGQSGEQVTQMILEQYATGKREFDYEMPEGSMKDADLRAAIFDCAFFDTVDLGGAQLEGASFRGAKLSQVDLTRASGLTPQALEATQWLGGHCPDGTNPDDNATPPTCLGHLSPP